MLPAPSILQSLSSFSSAISCQPDLLRKCSSLTSCHNILHFLSHLHCAMPHSHAHPLIPAQFILEKSLSGEAVQTALPRYVTGLFAHCRTGKSDNDTSSAELAEPGTWFAWWGWDGGWNLLAPAVLWIFKSKRLVVLYLRYQRKTNNSRHSRAHSRNLTARQTETTLSIGNCIRYKWYGISPLESWNKVVIFLHTFPKGQKIAHFQEDWGLLQ